MILIDVQNQLPDQRDPRNRLLESSGLVLQPGYYSIGLFSSLSLEELGSSSLLKRQETKYLLPKDRMQLLLQGLETEYNILEIQGSRSFDYLSRYFDTPDRLFYNQHQVGALPRWKIRQRVYLNSGLIYLDVKFKDNRGMTHKTRQQIRHLTDRLSEENTPHHESHYPDRIDNLKPVLETRYSRITLVRKTGGERITLDSQLRFSQGAYSQSLFDLVVAEIKQARLDPRSPFISHLKQIGARPGSFSKYCIGSTLLDPALKHNRFKPILHQINSLRKGEKPYEWAL